MPYDVYKHLVTVAETASDALAFDDAKAALAGEEPVPGEVLDRLLRGENPVKVWREHRGLQQNELAGQLGDSRGYLSHIESGRKEGTVELFRKLSQALDVSLDELLGWRE